MEKVKIYFESHIGKLMSEIGSLNLKKTHVYQRVNSIAFIHQISLTWASQGIFQVS